MSVPTGYTVEQFKEYLARQVGEMGTVLGWTAASPLIEDVVVDTLFEYHGGSGGTVEAAIDISKLRALGRYRLWVAVVSALASSIDIRSATDALTLSQYQEQARVALDLALRDAMPFARATGVIVTRRILPPLLVDEDDDDYARH